jgi:hypothetical protein
MLNLDILTFEERDVLLRWFMYRVDCDDRRKLAKMHPGIYSKMTGAAVNTDGLHYVEISHKD